ncbi:MAG: polyprenol phosphomannose-dependent alpha 1,6 mannosyltransferase MptB [Cyclobacteriaceae bacterium]|nr:polyprenol phosphomannose-dependent alpha 1,6 mannosyltransferase MptB [Cyclobacteriaceae bacterium]
MRLISKYGVYFLSIISAIAYIFLGYFVKRTDHLYLVVAYLLLFLSYIALLKYYKTDDFKKFFIISLIFRVLLLFSIPALSDDIYRFIWDGKLLQAGMDPYQYIPSALTFEDGFMQNLYENLNSQHYYSVYPPVSQWIFLAAVTLFPKSIIGATVVIRLLIILAETGTLFLLFRLLKMKHANLRGVFIYALNPLVILELTGNLHFEAFLIFFTLLAYTLLKYHKAMVSGIIMGLSIGVKLLPLIFLPFFLRRLSLKNNTKFFGVLGISLLVIFFPFFYSGNIEGIVQSITLYFKKFEFNASIYYLVREYGFYDKGYNIISTAGPKLALFTFVSIMGLVLFDLLRKRKLMEMMLFAGLIYFMNATTVHPWYVLPLLAFSTLTHFKWPVVWSFLIFFTYMGYTATGYNENYVFILLEYLVLALFVIYELWNNYSTKIVTLK